MSARTFSTGLFAPQWGNKICCDDLYPLKVYVHRNAGCVFIITRQFNSLFNQVPDRLAVPFIVGVLYVISAVNDENKLFLLFVSSVLGIQNQYPFESRASFSSCSGISATLSG